MLVLTFIAILVAAASAVVAVLALREAKRSAKAAEDSLAEAKRSADAAEKSAGAAAVTAAADQAEDHRQRTPSLGVTVEEKAQHDGTEVIYRVTNDGPADLDSIVVHRPLLGDVEGRIVHHVAPTGADYGDAAEIGRIAMGTYGRFTLSLGSGVVLPEFRVKIASTAGNESWSSVVQLDEPRKPPPPKPVAVVEPPTR